MIELAYKGQHLVINSLGGGIAQFYIDTKHGRRDIIFGYKTNDDKVASQGDVLFPFPGRVEQAQYVFDGQHYRLSGLRIKDGDANHGFVKFAEWEVLSQSDHSATLQFKIAEGEYEPKGYPFSMNLKLEYYLNDNGLTCNAVVENFGTKEAPFGLGFHPYFTLGTLKVDELFLQLPAREFVEFDNKFKPTGELLDQYDAPVFFAKKRKVGIDPIDNCFTDLKYEEGIAKTVLSNDQGDEITIWQDENLLYIQLYSGEGLKGSERHGLAIEPQTCCSYAFNVPSMGLRTLKPGARLETKWGVTLNIR